MAITTTNTYPLNLHSRVAIITGAATGIGRATALAFAQAGAAVVVNHLACPAEAAALVTEIQTFGGRALAINTDVTNAAQIDAMLKQVQQVFGSVHVLVNNAGILQEKPFLDTTEIDWDTMLAVDLKSVFLMCRAVLPLMLAQKSGVIINIASDLGLLGRAGFAPYCAAKAGVIGLTKSLAREFTPDIRVNAIAPGPVNTRMVSLESMSLEAMAKELEIPQHRVAEPEEIAATALFLASDLSRFYCGQVLGPNGGSVMP